MTYRDVWLWLLLASWVGSAAASDGVNGDIVPKAELLFYTTGDSLSGTLNPGNVARRPHRIAELATRLGVEFEDGEVIARLSVRRKNIDGQVSTESDNRLLRIYKQFQLSDSLGLTIGKKNLHLDSGYAFRPFDFFEDLTIAADFDDWRGREEGFPLVALSYAGQEVTLRALYADDSQLAGTEFNRGFKQGMLALDMARDNWNTTLLIQKYNVGSAGLGIGGSFTPSAGLALHGALFIRQGSIRPLHRGVLSDLPAVETPLNDPVGRWRIDSSKWRGRLLLGGQYTSDAQVNFLAEYFYDGNGLNDGEWNNFLRQVALHLSLPSSPLRSFNLASDSRSLATRRQHYLFLRLSFGNFLLHPEFSVLVGKDRSARWGVKMHHQLMEGLSAWLNATANTGSSSSEFGLLPVRNSLSLGLRWRF